MFNGRQDTVERIAYLLLNHAGNYQQCRDMVQQLIDLELLAQPDTHQERYDLLYNAEVPVAKIRYTSPIISRFWGSEENKKPDATLPECINSLHAQLQKQKEDAYNEKVQLEAQIKELEHKLEKKTQILEKERESWKQQLADSACYLPQDAQSILDQVNENRTQAFELTNRILQNALQFRQEQEQLLLQFKNQVSAACNNSGIEKLAELYSRMTLSRSPEVQAYLSSLKNIMTTFGMKPFKPQTGDAFDPRIHEPKILGQYGSRVTGCYGEGWMLGDQVILRAVVETEDE